MPPPARLLGSGARPSACKRHRFQSKYSQRTAVFHARVRIAVNNAHCKSRVGDGTDSQDACKCPFYAPTRGTPPGGMQAVRLEQAGPWGSALDATSHRPHWSQPDFKSSVLEYSCKALESGAAHPQYKATGRPEQRSTKVKDWTFISDILFQFATKSNDVD